MKILRNILPLFILLASFPGCAQENTSQSISVKEFKEKIKNDTSMVILDVRTNAEVSGPLLKINRAIQIPIQVLDKRVNELEQFKDREIVVVCRTQNRSSLASEFLNSKGYNTRYVTGGMTDYYKK